MVPERHRDWIAANFTEAGYLGDAPAENATENAADTAAETA